jgi:hypothetical protein
MLPSEFEQARVLEQKLIGLLQGNLAAVSLCMDVIAVFHLWDDLIDQDKEIRAEEINGAFWACFVRIPRNPFYQSHQQEIVPLIENIILAWHSANVLERGTDHEKHVAYGLRSLVVRLIDHCAYLVGGYEWARQIGPDVARLYDEPLESFMEEMKCQED